MKAITSFIFILSTVLMAIPALAGGDYGNNEIYIYNDRGACEDGCAEAVADLLVARGANYKYAKKSSISPKSLAGKKLWIQPGGDGIEMAMHLSSSDKLLLREFVANGGRYLGFCAGAFLADHFVDDGNTIPGLGLIPGVSRDFSPINKDEMILPILWNQILRYMYFQDGATFDLSPGAVVHTIAKYSNGESAVIQFNYGKGKVILSGVHPEANDDWRGKMKDPDGDDTYLAQELISELLQ